MNDHPHRVFYAIYDADSSIVGELRYLMGKLSGRANCPLCDVSHGWQPLGKRAWRERTGLASELLWVHRDEVPKALLQGVTDLLPCVIAVGDGLTEVILTREALSACRGDFKRFEEALEAALADQ